MSVHHDLPPEINVRDLPDGVRYELPLRYWGMWRWFGWACAGVSVACIFGLSLVIAHLIRTFGQTTSATVGYMLLTFGLAIACLVALYCALSTLCSWGVIEARETSIMRREHAGLFHRTHRRSIKPINRLFVALDTQAEDFDPTTRKRLGGMAYTLNAAYEEDKPFRVARWYSQELLAPLAHDLARRIGELRAHHFGRAQPPKVNIASDQRPGEAEEMDLTPIAPPKKTDIAIERAGDGVTIIVPPMRLIGGPGQSLTGLAMSGLAAAAIGLFIYTWLFGGFGSLMSWIVLLLAVPAMGSWMVFLGERLGERETYVDIVDEVLLISSKSIRGVRVREWIRDEIRDIRCGESMIEIDDNALPQLQIVTSDGQTHSYFTGRSRDEIRWLAYQLRVALNGETLSATGDRGGYAPRHKSAQRRNEAVSDDGYDLGASGDEAASTSPH